MRRIEPLTTAVLARNPLALRPLLRDVQALLPRAYQALLAGSASAQFVRPDVHADDVDIFVLAPSDHDQRAALHAGRELVRMCKKALTLQTHPDERAALDRFSALTGPLVTLRLNRPELFKDTEAALLSACAQVKADDLMRALAYAESLATEADATADVVSDLIALGFTEQLPDGDPQRIAEQYQAYRVLRLGHLHVIFTRRTEAEDLLANFDIPQHRCGHRLIGQTQDCEIVNYTRDSWLDLAWTVDRQLNVYRDSRVWRVEKAVKRGYYVDQVVLDAAAYARSIGQDRLSFARGDTPDQACVLVRSDNPAYAHGYRCFGATQYYADDVA
ncbi:hypothetical protein [Deinococcus soli (ex Cha et al. 2016)]|uniref:Uncharacterized protein n=2 Tax=Deinococcus soli (ex Cha et al. 2016) TaxID=1309411 RepID=A0ACC6KFR4_9DEIO|nr:hypothetical protein [Deinococcus soli (ex Cha et al. 2016)]MDR6218271.1 hypothetical protein [Deinococcus soli (ex Cha et al. 2016)]MDR6329011.1 hypothetical protein [Deinococcus soli (ex Cha et al. 2016)]MDR6751284.1 hypothetical protein [Deinococcus soli (ex Cha et al. 2016)]